MIVTEQEAKTKRCQESFGDTNLGSGYIEARAVQMGTQAFSTSPIHCIGSACMAWRWMLSNSHLGDKAMDRTKNDDRSLGYCGRAGG